MLRLYITVEIKYYQNKDAYNVNVTSNKCHFSYKKICTLAICWGIMLT